MKFYSKAALQLLYDQVNRDNPHLPVKLTPEIAALTDGPIAKSINGRNTQVTFTGFPGTGVQGRVLLYYDRVNLTTLFNFTPVVYFPASVTTVTDALPYINEMLGLSLIAGDVTTPNANVPAPNAKQKPLTLTILGSSPAYTGRLVLNYMIAESGYYPNSGPGPKSLRIGTQAMGYFGIASDAELMSRKDFMAAAFLKSTPTLISGAEGWHKFFYQGSVLYLPVFMLVQGVSWNTLYAEGLVYGTDNTGVVPGTPAVNQSRIIVSNGSEGRFYLRPRLPSYALGDPAQGTTAEKVGSELDMVSKLYNGEWSTPDNATPFTSYVLFRTTVAGSATAHLMGYLSSASGFSQAKATAYATGYWTPIVELVDSSTVLLGLEEFRGKVDVVTTPISFSAANQFSLAPIEFGLPDTIDYQPVTFVTENRMYLSPLLPYAPKTIDFGPIVFTASLYEPPPKISLASLDGELNGFN
ncbi:putative virion structural protein [Erwinia phage vB_EamM_Phobos]|uniref:virion structural protein n=1 Tax=Erwinia phage vB_EamM_Phobos TaxID=1883377 RepID=UPI00081C9FA5|nr:virion structural protein [Erwinia phage vB_EamM_Phobos]ANZ50336.1 putative virion structural protein [Erwinia phage vB_EamM_Phobos]